MKTNIKNYQKFLQIGNKIFLQMLVSVMPSDKEIPLKQKEIIENCFKLIDSDEIGLLAFEMTVYDLVVELDERMVVWKMFTKLRINQLLGRGPVYLYLISLPNIQNCIDEVVRLKDFILNSSYSIRAFESNQYMTIEVAEAAGETLASYLKNDTAICLVLYLFKQLAHQEFDFETIYIPDDRKHFDLKIASKFTNAKFVQHKGPMQAKFPITLVNTKNESYDKNINQQLKIEVDDLASSFLTPLAISELTLRFLSSNDKPAAQTIQTTALNFGISQTTFRRRLAKEKTSFKQLQSKLLEDICLKALLTTDIKIEALALKLGYSERSAFVRSFSAKFGVGPAEYRKLNNKL